MSKRRLLSLTAVVAACLCICWGAMSFANPGDQGAKMKQPIANNAAATLSSAQPTAATPALARSAVAVVSEQERAEKDRQILEEKQRQEGAASDDEIQKKLMDEYSDKDASADESMSPEMAGSVLTAEGFIELPNVAAPPDSGAPRDTLPGVKISQVYGAGGNVQAPTTNDYIELYNSGAPQLLTGWSVQYASSTGTFSASSTTPLPAITLGTGQYLLIQEAFGTSVIAGQAPALPTPDVAHSPTTAIAMAADNFKVALVNSTTPLASGTPTYAVHTTLKDFIGAGTANWNDTAAAGGAFLAANNTPAASVAHALYRLECGSLDTDNSRNDWAVGFPAARNTATALNGGITVIGTALPLTLEELQTARLTATPYRCATNDLGVGTTVSVDTTAIGGGPTAMLDDGVAPDEVMNDGIYTVLVTVAAGTTVGTKSLPVTVSDGGGLSGGSYIGIEVKPTTTPDNDNCYTAQAVAVPSTTTGTFTGATVESNSLSCYTVSAAGMSNKRGIWYTVVGTGNTITASLCASSPAFDAVMLVMCGSCDGFTLLEGNDTSPLCTGGAASVAWCSALGTTYYVWISPYSSGAQTYAFSLGISDNATPCTTSFPCTMCVGTPGPFTETEPGYGIHTNDGCASTPNLFTNVASPGATPSVLRGTARGMFGNRDVDSYRFQAASSGLFTMTLDTLGTNAQAQLYSLAAGGLCPQVSVVNTPVYVARCVSTIQTASAAVTAGTWYTIQVVGGIGIQVTAPATNFGGQMPGGTTYQYAITTTILPAGACCKVDGTCQVTTAAGCAAIAGAIYQGDDTTCTPTNPCPPAGACCMYDGTCVNGQTDVYCTSLGGIWQGAATACGFSYVRTTGGAWEDISTTGTEIVSLLLPSADDGGTNLPIGFTFNFYGLPYTNVWVISNGRLDVGATAYTAGYGAVIPTAAVPNNLIAALWRDLNCTGKSVRWQLFGTSPNQYLIVQYTGVVQYSTTYANTFQIVLFEGSDCIELRYFLVDPLTTGYRAGVENLTGTVGQEVTALVATGASIRLCPTTLTCPVNGACCHPDDTCTDGLQSACGDAFQGAGTLCAPGLCNAPTGACCFADGSCIELKEFICTQQGGTSWLVGVACDPNPCPQPDVGCCYPDGSCQMQTAAACTAAGGTPRTYPSTCTPACPQPGQDCINPVVVNIPAALPYSNTNTTCGMVNDYSTTCLGSYDGGEDILYRLDVTQDVCLTVDMDTTATWTGMSIDDSCPGDVTTCLYKATITGGGGVTLNNVMLYAAVGTYYVMIDTYPAPACIPTFNLTFTECPQGACCDGYTCTYGYQAACLAPSIFMGVGIPCDPNPCFTRACCFWPAGNCLNLTEEDCGTQGGNWDGAQTCGTKICPTPGNTCEEPMVLTLPAQLPVSSVNTTCGRVNDYLTGTTCLGPYYDGGEDMIYQVFVTQDLCLNVALTTPTTYTGMAISDVCPPAATCLYKATNSGAGGVTLNNVVLLASVGTYYIMIDTWPAPPCIPTFTLSITASTGCLTGACCVGATCSVGYEAQCIFLGGTYVGNGTTCGPPNPCAMGACCLWPSGECQYNDEPTCAGLSGTWHGGVNCTTFTCPTPGDNCSVPIMVALPTALPYTDPNQHTCGRAADYQDTCLGYYDGGEDIIYQLDVAEPICVNITATGADATQNWIGIGLDSVCPLGNPCMKTATSSGTTVTMSNVMLAAGTYYLMVDTWPTPNCLTDFTLTIVASTGCPSGACCKMDGTCEDMFQISCTAIGGTFGGVGSTCPAFVDCNANTVDDYCDILGGESQDCNDNGIPDDCDIAGGMVDADLNGVPDVCQPDCNDNGILDLCEVVESIYGGCGLGNCGTLYPTPLCGQLLDCQPNGTPDSCEIAGKSRVCDQTVYDAGICDGVNGTRPTVGWNDTGIVDKFVVPQGGNPLTFSCFHLDILDFAQVDMPSLRLRVYALPTGSIAADLPSFLAATAIFDHTYTVGGGELAITPRVPVCYPTALAWNYDASGPAYTLAAGSYALLVNFPGSGAVNYWASAADEGMGYGYVWGAQVNVPSVGTMAVAWKLTGGAAGGADCNDNGIPDFCDIRDCVTTGHPEWCDCDGNDIPDSCDIAADPTKDCNGNGLLDICDVPPLGTMPDCNLNLIPDSCELAAGTSLDCNNNAIPDECDLSAGTSLDCNGNLVPDECDIASYVSEDCQSDGIPDECQLGTGGGALVIDEGFDDILTLPGWYMQNNSNPLGTTNWFQGSTPFPAHSGAATSYIAANYNNTTTGTISNWLVTPEVTLIDGVVLDFYTRTATGSTWADRLQVHMSLSGASTNVGTGEFDVGDFTTLLLDINPTLVPTGYPQVWDPDGHYTITITGVPTATQGRLAFHYFVTDGGGGANSNYIGIDTVTLAGDPGIPANDCDQNGVPDECDLPDCNNNDKPDWCDIQSGFSLDENLNGIPDECDVPLCATCLGDVSGDGNVNGLDLQFFVDCLLGTGPSCACADMDGGGVGMSDISPFVDALLASPGPCP